jgi:acyl dehydratase
VTETTVGTVRTFTPEDQDAFALLSGDYNPMHVDPIAARRFLFGRTVVHGIHALLWAIDGWAEAQTRPVRVKSLKASFRRPVLVGEPVECAVRPVMDGRIRLDVTGDGASLLTATLTTEENASGGADVQSGTPERGPCLDRDAADVSAARGEVPLYFDRELTARLFPAVSRLLIAEQIAALLATTRLVGMEVPGLNSLYVGLDLLSPEGAASPALSFEVEKYDDRFSRLTLRVSSGGFCGTITAALRPPPRSQASFEQVRRMVDPREFHGVRALVIGGSRGLGEVAVKALSAGGADVRFTYHRGESDARAVAAEVGATVSGTYFSLLYTYPSPRDRG